MKTKMKETKRSYGISYDGKFRKEYEYFLTVTFDKPVDELALKYAMLVCCDDFTLDMPTKYRIGFGESDPILRTTKIETPTTFEAFLSIELIECALASFGDATMQAGNPAQPKDVYITITSNEKIDASDYADRELSKAAKMYDSLRRELEPGAYEEAVIHGIPFIKTTTEGSAFYEALLSDEERVRLVKAISEYTAGKDEVLIYNEEKEQCEFISPKELKEDTLIRMFRTKAPQFDVFVDHSPQRSNCRFRFNRDHDFIVELMKEVAKE